VIAVRVPGILHEGDPINEQEDRLFFDQVDRG
jgi:hypothetical protein